MDALIINDVHAGVQRTAGTTLLTATFIRDNVATSMVELIHQHLDKHLIINGDLFDRFTVSERDLLTMYRILYNWLENKSPEAKLFLLAGNHDLSAKGDKVSSFELLCRLLEYATDDVKIVLMDGYTPLYGSVACIPHCANQDLFDLALDEALNDPELGKGCSLLLHANYDNNFAVRSDHSLNVAEEIAKKFARKGVRLIFGHEHQKRELLNGMVYITGNQWATSVADCIGNEYKYAHVLRADGVIEPVMTQDITQDFLEIDWMQLAEEEITAKFIRVTGLVKPSQAADVSTAISKFRQRSKAWIVTHAVKVEGVGGMEEISFEEIKKFNVWEELMEYLAPGQTEKLAELRAMKGNENVAKS